MCGRRIIVLLGLLAALLTAGGCAKKNPVVIIETSMGEIQAELWPEKAPKTVANFLMYADGGFYDGTIFHRVKPQFMIQGGGFTPDMKEKTAGDPVRNEARADAPNRRGTLAMARMDPIDSATCQFFINVVDNLRLDHKDNTSLGYGYCVFGQVISGMNVVDKIVAVPTATVGRLDNVPLTPVIIKSIRRLGADKRATTAVPEAQLKSVTAPLDTNAIDTNAVPTAKPPLPQGGALDTSARVFRFVDTDAGVAPWQ